MSYSYVSESDPSGADTRTIRSVKALQVAVLMKDASMACVKCGKFVFENVTTSQFRTVSLLSTCDPEVVFSFSGGICNGCYRTINKQPHPIIGGQKLACFYGEATIDGTIDAGMMRQRLAMRGGDAGTPYSKRSRGGGKGQAKNGCDSEDDSGSEDDAGQPPPRRGRGAVKGQTKRGRDAEDDGDGEPSLKHGCEAAPRKMERSISEGMKFKLDDVYGALQDAGASATGRKLRAIMEKMDQPDTAILTLIARIHDYPSAVIGTKYITKGDPVQLSEEEVKQIEKLTAGGKLAVGNRIRRWFNDSKGGDWYPGTVTAWHGGSHTVNYDDGDESNDNLILSYFAWGAEEVAEFD